MRIFCAECQIKERKSSKGSTKEERKERGKGLQESRRGTRREEGANKEDLADCNVFRAVALGLCAAVVAAWLWTLLLSLSKTSLRTWLGGGGIL